MACRIFEPILATRDLNIREQWTNSLEEESGPTCAGTHLDNQVQKSLPNGTRGGLKCH